VGPKPDQGRAEVGAEAQTQQKQLPAVPVGAVAPLVGVGGQPAT